MTLDLTDTSLRTCDKSTNNKDSKEQRSSAGRWTAAPTASRVGGAASPSWNPAVLSQEVRICC